jgi:hypothetical protein
MAEDEEPGAERSVAQKDERIIRTNTVLAVSAILLSAISAGGVIWQVKVAADQRAATVWPYIQVFPARNSSPPFFAIQMVNVGVGPALIRYFAVRVDDKPSSLHRRSGLLRASSRHPNSAKHNRQTNGDRIVETVLGSSQGRPRVLSADAARRTSSPSQGRSAGWVMRLR